MEEWVGVLGRVGWCPWKSAQSRVTLDALDAVFTGEASDVVLRHQTLSSAPPSSGAGGRRMPLSPKMTRICTVGEAAAAAAATAAGVAGGG